MWKAVSSALRVMSGRFWVLEAPQSLQRQRVRPTLVVPFLTSLWPRTPHTGDFRRPDTEHAFSACLTRHHPRSKSGDLYTHFGL